MKRYIKDYALLTLVAGLIVVLDQYTKNLVRTRLALGEVWLPFGDAVPFVRVVHWYNTGVAFGMFQGRGLIFTILAFVVIGLIYFFYAQVPAKDWPLRIAMILQVGGAAGNLVDRLQFGQVTDFISVGNFAVFNVADSAITVGVFVLLLGVWLQDQAEKKLKQETEILVSTDSDRPADE